MKLTVKDLGPIEEATIDLNKELIVLCGPNQTGKTYLNYAIHFLNNGDLRRLPQSSYFYNQSSIIRKISEEIYDNNFSQINLGDINVVSEILQGFCDNYSKFSTIYFRGDVIPEPKWSLKIEEAEFDKEYFYNHLANFTEGVTRHYQGTLVVQKGEESQLIFKNHLRTEKNISPFGKPEPREQTIESQMIMFSDIFQRFFFPHACCLVAERNTLISLYLNLDNSEVSNSNPPPITDLIRLYKNIAQNNTESSPYASLAQAKEKEWLGGAYQMKSDGGLIFQLNEQNNQSLRITHTGTAIKSLGSLFLYLKHIAQPGDRLIIDEPEQNLHPSLQVQLCRFLVELVNKGLQIIISTHSDYILRELNNMILLGSVKPEQIAKRDEIAPEFGFTPEHYIDHKRVGAYFFRKNMETGKVKVEDLEVTDSGFVVESIDNTITSLGVETDSLYYALTNLED